MKLDDLASEVSDTSQAFVAMWFSEQLEEAWQDGLAARVQQAGYGPVRVDRIEHINKIDDEIIAQIKASHFLVADFTGHRGGVYFEAGYALGLGIPVFWTCRKDHLEELHFDIRQYNCIDWDTATDLCTRLGSRIRAVLGPGPINRETQ